MLAAVIKSEHSELSFTTALELRTPSMAVSKQLNQETVALEYNGTSQFPTLVLICKLICLCVYWNNHYFCKIFQPRCSNLSKGSGFHCLSVSVACGRIRSNGDLE